MTPHRCGACIVAVRQCALCETRDALYRANALIGEAADEGEAATRQDRPTRSRAGETDEVTQDEMGSDFQTSLAVASATPRSSARRSPTAGNRGQGGKWLKPSTRRRIYARDEYKCVWCFAPVASIANPAHLPAGTRQATVDHVVPRVRGGSNRPSNLITCCAGCNAKRGHRSVPAFATALCAKLGALRDDRAEHIERIVCHVRAHARRKLPAQLRYR